MATINTVSVADATKWNEEFIEDYAISEAVVSKMFMNQGWLPGNGTVTFTIVQNNAQATTRDRNGNIVYGLTDQDTTSVTLTEALGAEKITNFDAFKSSVDQRNIMYMRVRGALNRDINDKCLTVLDGATNVYNSGTAVQATKAHVKKLIQSFWESTLGAPGEAMALISPAMNLQLKEIAQITSKDYVDSYKLDSGMMAFSWEGITWVPFAGVSGMGTADCKCFLFHKNALAFKEAGALSLRVGFNDEQLYWYCNGQEWCAAKLLLATGVYEFHHNDTSSYA